MRVLIRSTATGTEYWDAKEKRTIFVSAGSKPDFEITKNPESMIYGIDLSGQDDKTVIVKLDDEKAQGTIIDTGESEEPENTNSDNAETEIPTNQETAKEESDNGESAETEKRDYGLEELSIKELHGYAESVEMEIPKSAKTKKQIIEFLESQEIE